MPIFYPLPLLSHHGIKVCPIKLIYISLKREKFFLHDIIFSNKWGALSHSCIERISILQNTRSIFPLTVFNPIDLKNQENPMLKTIPTVVDIFHI